MRKTNSQGSGDEKLDTPATEGAAEGGSGGSADAAGGSASAAASVEQAAATPPNKHRRFSINAMIKSRKDHDKDGDKKQGRRASTRKHALSTTAVPPVASALQPVTEDATKKKRSLSVPRADAAGGT